MLDFTYPLILTGISLIILPILIHLISKSRRKRINFPTIFLFEKEIVKASNISRLSDILLMLIRVFIVLILSLLFASPYLKTPIKKDDGQIKSEDKLYFIIIDDTFSTSYIYQTDPFIEILKKEAIQFINYSEDSATFGIAHFNSFLKKPFYSKNKKDIINHISLISPSQEADISVSEMINIYVDDVNSKPEKKKHLVIFSDFQKYDWNDVFIDGDFTSIVKEIDKTDYKNFAITNPSSPKILNYVGQPIDIYFTLSAYLNKPDSKKIEIFNGVNKLLEQTINIEMTEDIEQKVQIRLFDVGKINLKIKLNDDNYEYDDYAYQTINTIKNMNVLIFAPENEQIISKALKSSIGTKQQSDMRLINIDNKPNKTRQYDVIIAYNITKLSTNETNYIVNEAKRGKIVIILYSKNDNLFNLDKLINQMIDGVVFGEQVSSTATITYPDDLFNQEEDLSHLLLNTYNTHFTSRIKTKIDNNKVNRLLSLSDNSNLLLSNRNKNNVYFFASEMSFGNSNLTYTQTLPLLMNEIIYIGTKWKHSRTYNTQNGINPSRNIINQGRMDFISINELSKLIGSNVDMVTYKDISQLNHLFIKSQDTQKEQKKGPIQPIMYILLAIFLIFTLFDMIYSAFKKG